MVRELRRLGARAGGRREFEAAWSHNCGRGGDGVAKSTVGAAACVDWGLVCPDDDKSGKGAASVSPWVARRGGRSLLLGGNQGNRVKCSACRKAHIHAYRAPEGYTPPVDAYESPVLEIAAGGGGKPGTKAGDAYYCFALP